MPEKNIISYRNVYKSFGDQHVCIDFNLNVKRGEILTIFGPSGIGKTVTIKMLVGLIEADSGEIIFAGQDLCALRNEKAYLPFRRRIAMVFQGAALFDSFNVFENIAFPLREHFKLSEKELEDRVAEKLEWVGLAGSELKMPEELSGGMKKRIGLARAIAMDPEVILYDEPTAGLDPINTYRIAHLIESLQEKLKCTSILVTHDLGLAKGLSNEVAFMNDGRIRALGSFESLKKGSDQMVAAFLAEDMNKAAQYFN